MKRILSLTLALVMVLGTFTAVFAAEPTVEEAAGAFLEKVGVLLGDDEGDLLLEENLERRDAVILLSRLLEEEEVAKEFPTSEESPSWTDARTDAYYVPFFAWAEANKYFEGNDDGTFAPREAITAQEYALVLLRALGYEASGHDAWKAALETAKELGLLVDVEVKDADKVLRGQMAVMTLNALGTKINDSDKTLAEELGIEMPRPAEASKVEEVKADNLKEVVVVFDGEVEKASAEIKENYSLDKGEIEKAVLSEDRTEVVLTVKEAMENQKERKLTVRNIKTADATLATETIKFIPVDRNVPEVVSVDALGNKAVKVTFSEPVDDKTVAISGFRIDGKAISGSVDKNNGRTVIVKLYNKLSDGSHEIEVKGIKDFAGYLMVTTEREFEVVEDKEAPAIDSVEATLEYVTVKFTEPVQDSTVKGGSYAYWKATESTTTKKTSAISRERLTEDTYRFDFTKNPLPGYPVYLYIEGVKDYSDNTIAKDSPVLVTAEIDQVRPEVVSVKVDEDTNKSIEIKFTKSIENIKDRTKYVLKNDKDKKISIQSVTSSDNDKTATVNLYSALERGTYTLELQGLTDKTALKNAIMPYTTTLEVKGIGGPVVKSVSVKERQIYIQFDKKMTIDGEFGVANPDNYFIKYDGKTRALPEDAEIEVFAEGKTVMITMPEKIGKEEFKATKLQEITVQKVKDIDGVQLNGYSKTIKSTSDEFDQTGKFLAKKATLKDSKTVVVEFNQIVTEHNKNISVEGASVEYHELDGNTVKLTLKDDMYTTKGLTVTVPAESFTSVTGAEVEAETLSGEKFEDKVAPVLKNKEDHDEFPVEDETTTAPQIKIEFIEELTTENQEYLAAAFVVVRGSDDKELTVGRDYNATLSDDHKVVIITLTDEALRDSKGELIKGEIYFNISLKEKSVVKDLNNNSAEAFENIPTAKGIKVAE